MRPASRNPESAQTLPHVKPPKTNIHQKKKKKKNQQWGHAEDTKGYKIGYPNNNNNKKKSKIMVKSCVGFSGKRCAWNWPYRKKSNAK